MISGRSVAVGVNVGVRVAEGLIGVEVFANVTVGANGV